VSYRGELPIAVGLEAAGWTALPSCDDPVAVVDLLDEVVLPLG
jgi:hypothetical protein